MMERNIKGVLFDLDDTIINFSGVIKSSWEKSCQDLVQEFALDMDANIIVERIMYRKKEYWDDEVTNLFGRRSVDQARVKVVSLAFNDLGILNSDTLAYAIDKYDKYRYEAIYLFPHAIETLQTLKDKGMKLAVLMNGESARQREKIERFGLGEFFDLILIEEELGYGKPNPMIYDLAMKKLGLTKDEVCIVGDNLLWEVRAPQSLGIYAVWHDYQRLGLPEQSLIIPDCIIHHIDELLGCIA